MRRPSNCTHACIYLFQPDNLETRLGFAMKAKRLNYFIRQNFLSILNENTRVSDAFLKRFLVCIRNDYVLKRSTTLEKYNDISISKSLQPLHLPFPL